MLQRPRPPPPPPPRPEREVRKEKMGISFSKHGGTQRHRRHHHDRQQQEQQDQNQRLPLPSPQATHEVPPPPPPPAPPTTTAPPPAATSTTTNTAIHPRPPPAFFPPPPSPPLPPSTTSYSTQSPLSFPSPSPPRQWNSFASSNYHSLPRPYLPPSLPAPAPPPLPPHYNSINMFLPPPRPVPPPPLPFPQPSWRQAPPQTAPPDYVDHSHAKKIKNDVNVRKDSIKIVVDDENLDSYLVSFTFDAAVDGSITIMYFGKEGANCTFMPLYPEIHTPRRIPFTKGLGQKFCQPSGTGIDLGFFELDQLSRSSAEEDIFPLIICAEAGLTSFSTSAESDRHLPSHNTQFTQAVLQKNSKDHFEVKVVKQILWVDGVRYELREIYGIGNSEVEGLEDNDSGKECVICMSEPKNTAVLPCRHMCLCSECAKALRLQANKCPVCRQPIQELMEIKID